ncbi:MAG TPA: hypothetical protein VFJ70_01965 [Burkholderiales bacterium]|nr:hypothetical protein [Burkholderiales bacterium]
MNNQAINDLCTCANCAGQDCQCGCQAAAQLSDARPACNCGPACKCGTACRCDTAEQGCRCQA